MSQGLRAPCHGGPADHLRLSERQVDYTCAHRLAAAIKSGDGSGDDFAPTKYLTDVPTWTVLAVVGKVVCPPCRKTMSTRSTSARVGPNSQVAASCGTVTRENPACCVTRFIPQLSPSALIVPEKLNV